MLDIEDAGCRTKAVLYLFSVPQDFRTMLKARHTVNDSQYQLSMIT